MIVWIEIISAAATVIAIAGVILNNHRRRECFIVWFGSNILTLSVHLYVGLWAMSGRDLIFIGLAIDGWIRWSKKTPKREGASNE